MRRANGSHTTGEWLASSVAVCDLGRLTLALMKGLDGAGEGSSVRDYGWNELERDDKGWGDRKFFLKIMKEMG